ncbi:carbonic anhydrase [Lindgomyces ingoldianus]|uniref:Carbonic anhydrase n=1 Tax=Lindgomyces ingoldianus TaxID=673940 RepID=A0ACB6QUH0_9PLEO|nr:carbonic anhydrase [Lindgomyces ingoldianus]KAF2469836.1 carbonic anhydrase [Lindgomyces ingoldianus]
MQLTTQDLLDRHEASLCDHKSLPLFSELADVGVFPRIFIISCVDPRCVPENIFGIRPGEVDAVVFRVAGGNSQFALNSLLAVDTLAGLMECIIIQHTDCGATMFRDANIKDELKKRAPDMGLEIESLEFGQITGTLEENVKKSMDFLRMSPLVRPALKSKIRGFVYDIITGKLKEVLA